MPIMPHEAQYGLGKAIIDLAMCQKQLTSRKEMMFKFEREKQYCVRYARSK